MMFRCSGSDVWRSISLFRAGGSGGALLLRAAARCIRVADEIGGVAMLIDAKNERSAQWCGGFGAVQLLDADPLSLVLPLALAADAIKRGG